MILHYKTTIVDLIIVQRPWAGFTGGSMGKHWTLEMRAQREISVCSKIKVMKVEGNENQDHSWAYSRNLIEVFSYEVMCGRFRDHKERTK